jgi:hypothetical protein
MLVQGYSDSSLDTPDPIIRLAHKWVICLLSECAFFLRRDLISYNPEV